MSYLYELLVSLINLAENTRSVLNKVFDCIHVVEGDEEDVLRTGAEKDLVLESHGHQIIELSGRKYMHNTDLSTKIN